ncbi:MAG: PEGA domain-containing protein, partial [Spirochaeta sp.]|nr:PEGA domain-containing protein [Spirochaeta sp.]
DIPSQGYLDEYRQIELFPGEHYDLRIALAAGEMEYLSVNSEPQGASVYDGSQWLGRTSLEMAVPAPEARSRLLLRKEGYKDYPFYLDSSFTGNIDLTLEHNILEESVVQTKKRDQFYSAFGIWALTMPLPLFLYGITADYALAYQKAAVSGNLSEAYRLQNTGEIFYYSYLGALFITGSVFIKMMFNLFNYIRSADRKAG